MSSNLQSHLQSRLQVNLRGYLALGLTTISWASAFPAIRIALEGYSPNNVAFLRYLLASGLLALYWAFQKIALPQKEDWWSFCKIAFAGITFYNLALNYGEMEVSASAASFLVASGPIWIAILASKFQLEEIPPLGWFGIFTSFMGVAVITLSKGFVVSEVFPTLAIVAAAFAQSIYSLCQKKLLGRYRPLQLTSYMIWIGTILLFPFTKNLWQQASTAPSQATIALVILGIVPSIVGYVSWNYALSMLSASKAGIVLYLLPVASLFISWVCLNEAPTLVSILGGSIVLMGVIFLSFSKSRQLKNAIST